jgi:hypothetical protein
LDCGGKPTNLLLDAAKWLAESSDTLGPTVAMTHPPGRSGSVVEVRTVGKVVRIPMDGRQVVTGATAPPAVTTKGNGRPPGAEMARTTGEAPRANGWTTAAEGVFIVGAGAATSTTDTCEKGETLLEMQVCRHFQCLFAPYY